MNSGDDNRDLPVPATDDDLPIPLPEVIPHEEQVLPKHSGWFNIASQCHIRHLAVDPLLGDLWLATGGGILRWRPSLDRFTRYTSEHGLPGNAVKAIAVDGASQVWAVHDSFGLCYLEDDAWHSYAALYREEIDCLQVDLNGQLWIGTDRGIYSLTSPTDEPSIEIPPAATPPRALTITEDNDLWLCNAQGIFNFQGDRWIRYMQRPDILTLVCQGKNLWLGTMDGLLRVDLAIQELSPTGTWPRGEVLALAPDSLGVWAVCGRSVGLLTETGWHPIKGHPHGRVTSLAPAGDAGVWIGTHTGLQHGSPDRIRFHLTESPPDVINFRFRDRAPVTFSNMVQALAIQSIGAESILWVATARGLFRIELSANTWRRMGKLGAQDVRTLVLSESGDELWIASWTDGLYYSSIQKPFNLENCRDIHEPVLVMAAGLASACWAVSFNGLYRSDGCAWTQVLPANQMPSRGLARAIAQVDQNCLCIGTSAGLFVYNPGKGFPTSVSGKLSTISIQAILAVPDHSYQKLWVGTSYGLYSGKLGDLNPVPGVEHQSVTALAWDSKTKSIWVGTDSGLFHLQLYDDTWKITDEFSVQNSGLAHNRITALALSANTNGGTELWIGTSCGLSRYTYAFEEIIKE